MADSVKKIHVLTGCSAVGKTEWALKWALKHSAEIISCDSLLFYRGMNIGTAKPTQAELREVPHHLIDIIDVKETFDITRFVQTARAAAEDILQRGRNILVAGGSGFYLKAFFSAVSDGVQVPPATRSAVQEKLEKEGLDALVDELFRLNQAGLGNLDVDNPRRVTRALERCLTTGRPLAELTAEFAAQPGPFADYEVTLTRLDRSPAELEKRITQRVQGMLDCGLVEEVKTLRAEGLEKNPSASKAIGYRETLSYLDGKIAWQDLAPAIVANTRALVKKQRTWFRTQLPEHRVLMAEEVRDYEALFV